jgi:DNA-directed RNA polymerase subunit RPC12/RpoP
MLVGRCMKCGKQYIGWALQIREYQLCPVCGSRLIIRNTGENYKPGAETMATSQRDGIAEWQEALENTLPHFLL